VRRIRTAIIDNADRRPGAPAHREVRPEAKGLVDMMRAHEDSAMDPAEAGHRIRDAVVAGRFWALPNAEPHLPMILADTDDLLAALGEA
jgi:hypothetical protein